MPNELQSLDQLFQISYLESLITKEDMLGNKRNW